MGTDHRREDASQWGREQARAWETWDFAVVSAQALGWQLMQLTHRLISANCAWGAQAVAEVDRKLYYPTAQLASVSRVTRAIGVASSYDRALVASGMSGIIRELELIGHHNSAVADAIAGWEERVERQRDRIAGAALELRQAYLVAVGGGPRAHCSTEEDAQLI